ncbi:MAG: DUF393 domain-containing protein [Verrucomicrobia bacterium]|nr:DUF393 domain-containing protein [Verrucomicrobiota bacterium]
MREGEANILFFDGVCGFCNKTVDFVLRADRNRVFLYSPLQGETFGRITQNHPVTQTEAASLSNLLFVFSEQIACPGKAVASERLPYLRRYTDTIS